MDEGARIKNQRYNLWLVATLFMFTTLSGAVRKWWLTDNVTSNLLLGLQLGAPVLFSVLARTAPLNRFTRNTIIIYSLILLVMTFNPLAKTYYHGIIGYFLHVGIFFPVLIYLNDRDAFPVEQLDSLFLLVALSEVILGGLQFSLPSTHLLNRYVRDDVEFATSAFTGRVRITGTFSYLGGLTSLFLYYGFVIWGLRLRKSSFFKLFGFAIACMVVVPMTSSRGLSATIIIFLLFSFVSTASDFRATIAVFIIAGLLYWAYLNNRIPLLDEAVGGLQARVEYASVEGENAARSFGPLQEIIDFKGNYPLFGTGLGGTYQGAKALFGESLYVQEYGYYEEDPERIIIEGGFTLFFIRLLLWGLLIQRSRIPWLFGLPLIYLFVFNTQTVYNVFTVTYTFLGVIYLDRSFYLREQAGRQPEEETISADELEITT